MVVILTSIVLMVVGIPGNPLIPQRKSLNDLATPQEYELASLVDHRGADDAETMGGS